MARPEAPIDDGGVDLDDASSAELDAIYEELERRLAAVGAACDGCGRCCRFREWGHEVWLTPIELARLLDAQPPRAPSEPGVCPFLADGRCTARSARTLGCRAFFCRLEQETVEELYAEMHARIVKLHERLGVEVRFGELLASLAARQRSGDSPSTSE